MVAVVLLIIISASSGGSGGSGDGVASHFSGGGGGAEDVASQLSYIRARQGLDPEAVPALALIGVSKSGSTDLYRRLLARYPALQGGLFRETNFLLQCQQDAGALLTYRRDHAHCAAAGGDGDPACHGCSALGYAALFNTTAVRSRLGACAHPLSAQALCAGGWLEPDGVARAPAADGYRPAFTVDASKAYSSGAGAAQRAATLLAALSPRTKVALLLRDPADMGRALYNSKLTAECGTHECDGRGGGVGGGNVLAVPPYATLVDRELQFLNSSAAQALLTRLFNATRPPDARAAELALAANWTAYATRRGWPPAVWGHQLFVLHGVYTPVVLAWAERFVQAGRPMLVVQSEAYFQRAPALVDDVFGAFLFGGATEGTAAFAAGSRDAGLQPAARGRYGAKATQTVAQRCAVADALRGASRALEKQLARYAKAGKVQLLRANPTGPMWPRPAVCAQLSADPDAAGAAVATAGDYDYFDVNAVVEPDVYSSDYDYGYEWMPMADYETPNTANNLP